LFFGNLSCWKISPENQSKCMLENKKRIGKHTDKKEMWQKTTECE